MSGCPQRVIPCPPLGQAHTRRSEDVGEEGSSLQNPKEGLAWEVGVGGTPMGALTWVLSLGPHLSLPVSLHLSYLSLSRYLRHYFIFCLSPRSLSLCLCFSCVFSFVLLQLGFSPSLNLSLSFLCVSPCLLLSLFSVSAPCLCPFSFSFVFLCLFISACLSSCLSLPHLPSLLLRPHPPRPGSPCRAARAAQAPALRPSPTPSSGGRPGGGAGFAHIAELGAGAAAASSWHCGAPGPRVP